MKKITLFLVAFLLSTAIFAQQRECASMDNLNFRLQNDPGLQKRMNEIETYTQSKIQQMQAKSINGDIITIPVVVHVIYSNSNENISDAQIQSQIDVLNEDYRRLNSDADNTWSQAADTQIEFCLASVDPNGNTTNGITRKSSTTTSWGTNDAMKYTSQGGVDAWDTSQYLNMWVCNIGGGILGYAQFPGGNAATDGVVMGPNYFGSSAKGSGFYLSAPFDLGRTTTHEVGHFLNLRHIWGDGNCNVDDFVSDTPSSDAANYGCSIGHVSCNTVDMVQNYMDYSDDSCMNLFTQGQTNRMRAVLLPGGVRASLGASNKCDGGGTTPTCNDGIQNGDETGIDCGGSCAPCQTGPQYCASNGNSVADEYIGRVQIGSIDNTTGGVSGGYADYTSISTDLNKGSSVTITITPIWTGTVYSEGYSVWIDYNKDGDFDDSGEQVWTAAATQNSPVSGTFTVPTSAVTDATRMRVSMKYNGIPTACESFSYGEVEDYTVNLVTGAADTTPPVITLNGASTIDLEVGDTYTELGATATDNVDGDISANIVITGTVNTNTEGTYTRYYNVSDAAGNAATQVTRTINVTQPTGGTCSTTVSSFPYSEGFESNFGLWTQSTDDDMDWTRDSNGTPSSSTGPSSAAEGTYYIYTEASSPNYPSKVAILDGPCFDVSGLSNPTLTFQYHMYGATMGTLSLQARPDGSNTWTTIWSLSGNQGNSWQEAEVNLSSYSTVQLRFQNSTGSSYTGDATIDDINIFDNVIDSEAPSVPTNLAASNTTETTTELSWTASTDNVAVTGYDVYQDESLVTSVTGTSYLVTGLTPSTDYSFYVTAKDAAGNASGNSNTVNVTTATPADIIPPVITLIGAATINLQVGDTYTEQGATATDNVDGDISANIVITGTVNTNTVGTYSRFYNVSDAAGNTATQVTRTIIVTQPSTGGCSGGITAFSYSESFENTLGAWTQSSADDFNWTVDANGTPSSNTGPSSASAGTYYVYMESSSPNYSNKRAILNSPCFDLGSETEATFTFDYHMYGASTMGSLALEVSTDDGATWTSVWSQSGNQGNSWLSASVDLNAYIGGSVQLRFNGITGTTWQGDMALDNVGFLTSGGGGTGCSNVTLSITFDNYPEETAWSITNASGQTVASGGTYGSQADGSTLNINVGCLDDGCYDFTITDTYGDGICCAYGNGSYTLTNNDTGSTLASGGSFASSETTNFCIGGTTRSQSNIVNLTDDIDTHLALYPNPVDTMLHVDLIGFEAQSFVIKNMLGQVMLKGRYTSIIDVSDLQSGIYVLQLNISEKTKVKRFIKK